MQNKSHCLKWGAVMTEYKYGMRLRVFSPGAQPLSGFTGVAEGYGRYHNILVYKRKLTEKEMKSYDLDYLGEIINEQQTS